MLFYNSFFYSILISLIFLTFNLFIFNFLIKKLNIEKNIAYAIFFCSLIFTIFYLLNDVLSILKITPGSDAISFYFNADEKVIFDKVPLRPGDNFLYYFIYLLKIVQLDFISINFFFGILSSASSLIFFGCISKYFTTKYDKYIILVFTLLPSYNYWGTGVSKDTITIFLFSIFLLSFVQNNFRYFLISLILLSLIRVHLALLILLSLVFCFILIFLYSSFFKKKLIFFNRPIDKINFILLFLGGLIFSFSIIYIFFLVPLLNILQTIDHFQTMYPGANFIHSSNFFFRIFEYFFRPFLWEKGNFLINIIKIENIFIFLLIFLLILKLISILIFKKIVLKEIDLSIFILVSFIFIGVFQIILTSNYGIALRQKWSFLPGLIFFIYYFNFFLQKNSIEKKQKNKD